VSDQAPLEDLDVEVSLLSTRMLDLQWQESPLEATEYVHVKVEQAEVPSTVRGFVE
jgi:hypothetical protein